MQITTRQALPEDLDNILLLFKETIETINAKDYSYEQIRAWSNGAYKKEKWLVKIKEQFFLIASDQNKIVGFGSMTNSGYLDLLYVSKDYQRMGIAKMIYDNLLEFAKANGLDEIISDVSITAKPFFEKEGFETIHEQQVFIDGILLKNFKMAKSLH